MSDFIQILYQRSDLIEGTCYANVLILSFLTFGFAAGLAGLANNLNSLTDGWLLEVLASPSESQKFIGRALHSSAACSCICLKLSGLSPFLGALRRLSLIHI